MAAAASSCSLASTHTADAANILARRSPPSVLRIQTKNCADISLFVLHSLISLADARDRLSSSNSSRWHDRHHVPGVVAAAILAGGDEGAGKGEVEVEGVVVGNAPLPLLATSLPARLRSRRRGPTENIARSQNRCVKVSSMNVHQK